MREFKWTINEVDSQPYEKLMKLVLDKEKENVENNLQDGAEFIKNL